VSCYARTLIRDLKIWTSCGYELRELAALDMFPFTDFLETVSRLEKTA
jgi:tRNA/tmRNA/rRNA uracil-C5-methylase (TrmA/RlmC/RlmD family)